MANIGFYSQENISFKLNGPFHSNEDKPLYIKLNDEVTGKPAYILGILDGHDGDTVVKYAHARLLDFFKDDSWIKSIHSEIDVCEYLVKVLVTIDQDFLQSLRANELPLPDEQHSLMETQDEDLMQMVSSSEQQEMSKSCGGALVIGLVLRDKLYVANVGDCHAVLCQTDPVSQQRFCTSLTVEHTLQNDLEVQRLQKCGLSTEAIRMMGERSKYNFTRCLGDYRLKCQYQNFPYLKMAKSPPVIALPQITGGLPIESTWRHLIFVSSGVCRLMLQLVYDRDKVDGELGHSLYQAHEKLSGENIVTLNDVVKCVTSDLSEKCQSGYRYLQEAGADESDFIGHGDLSIMVYQFPSQREMRAPSPLFDTNDNCEAINELSLNTTDDQPPEVEFQPPPDNCNHHPRISIIEPQMDLSPEKETSQTRSTTNNSTDDSVKPLVYVNFDNWNTHLANLKTDVLAKLEAIVERWSDMPEVDTILEEEISSNNQSRRTSEAQTGEISFLDLSHNSAASPNNEYNLSSQTNNQPSLGNSHPVVPVVGIELDLMSLPTEVSNQTLNIESAVGQ